jgi:hypothetical protein
MTAMSATSLKLTWAWLCRAMPQEQSRRFSALISENNPACDTRTLDASWLAS